MLLQDRSQASHARYHRHSQRLCEKDISALLQNGRMMLYLTAIKLAGQGRRQGSGTRTDVGDRYTSPPFPSPRNTEFQTLGTKLGVQPFTHAILRQPQHRSREAIFISIFHEKTDPEEQ